MQALVVGGLHGLPGRFAHYPRAHSNRKDNPITGAREFLDVSWGDVLRRKNDIGTGQWNWFSWAGRGEARRQRLDYRPSVSQHSRMVPNFVKL